MLWLLLAASVLAINGQLPGIQLPGLQLPLFSSQQFSTQFTPGFSSSQFQVPQFPQSQFGGQQFTTGQFQGFQSPSNPFASNQFSGGQFSTGQFSNSQFSNGQFPSGQFSNGQFPSGQFQQQFSSPAQFSNGQFSSQLQSPQFSSNQFVSNQMPATQFTQQSQFQSNQFSRGQQFSSWRNSFAPRRQQQTFTPIPREQSLPREQSPRGQDVFVSGGTLLSQQNPSVFDLNSNGVSMETVRKGLRRMFQKWISKHKGGGAKLEVEGKNSFDTKKKHRMFADRRLSVKNMNMKTVVEDVPPLIPQFGSSSSQQNDCDPPLEGSALAVQSNVVVQYTPRVHKVECACGGGTSVFVQMDERSSPSNASTLSTIGRFSCRFPANLCIRTENGMKLKTIGGDPIAYPAVTGTRWADGFFLMMDSNVRLMDTVSRKVLKGVDQARGGGRNSGLTEYSYLHITSISCDSCLSNFSC